VFLYAFHLDQAKDYDVDVVIAGTPLANDGEAPVGSIFVIETKDRTATDAFTRSDPYHVNKVCGSNPRLQYEARHAYKIAAKSIITRVAKFQAARHA
jgi:uncharacterized protein YciI